MEVSKRELIDLVRDAFNEGYYEGETSSMTWDDDEVNEVFRLSDVRDSLLNVLHRGGAK